MATPATTNRKILLVDAGRRSPSGWGDFVSSSCTAAPFRRIHSGSLLSTSAVTRSAASSENRFVRGFGPACDDKMIIGTPKSRARPADIEPVKSCSWIAYELTSWRLVAGLELWFMQQAVDGDYVNVEHFNE